MNMIIKIYSHNCHNLLHYLEAILISKIFLYKIVTTNTDRIYINN